MVRISSSPSSRRRRMAVCRRRLALLRQRALAMAATRKAVLHGEMTGDGRLYVLDEPFAGVDGEGRARMVRWMRRRLEEGAGLLLAAHDSDAPELESLGATRFELRRKEHAS